ncbi:hypothetical protein AVEN_265173-1 [Araneus ventricosus]|uniref:Uncharacterized protein n=1 Tax=Araneus ventricosus TaxID=182803 RepID=A0A4Y2CS53_ARAVE|nr:hypothetical protein AVEN_265173-1 [Araneus ventricosus]
MVFTQQSVGRELPLSCQGIQGLPNDSHCNGSSTEAGVLVVITGHDPTPPVGGTYYHWREVTRPPPLLCPRRSEIPLTYLADSYPRLVLPPREIEIQGKEYFIL